MFIKQQQTATHDQNGRKLYWGRAGLTAAPFRSPSGAAPPLLKENEYEEAVGRVYDCQHAIFDVRKPEEKQHGYTYQSILDNIACGWWVLLYEDQKWHTLADGNVTMLVYIRWAMPFDEPDPNFLRGAGLGA